jgi:hypothetical protein
LKEPLVRFLLYINQVRDRHGGLNFGEVQAGAFPNDAITVAIAH